uniref:Uncharacterized protein n=1 Tax=Avena sativa TaxID=4498 RepID=A0ACD5UXW5_AVESA
MSSFWGTEVKPEKPYTLTPSARRGRLRLTQATLGADVGKVEKGRKNLVQVQCTVKNKDPVYLCALVSGQSETCHLDLEFEEKSVTFSVLGPRSVHLAGYYVPYEDEQDMDGCDTCSDSQGSEDDVYASDEDDLVIPVSHGQMSTDSEDDSDFDSDYDSDDDEDLMYDNQPRGKSSVVIEEIQEDDKPAGGEGHKGKRQSSEDGDSSGLQLAVGTPTAESLESEDEDGFPVSESKSSKGSSKKETKSNEDRKRKSGDITEPSGEANAENGMVSKKKKKAKDKMSAVDNEKVNDEEKGITQESSADISEAKQKKKKSKKASASEAGTDQHADEKTVTDNDVEEPSKQGAKKKKNKKKTKENNTSENQAQTDVLKSDSSKEETSQTRTFGSGLIIQTVALGKPDGKKAVPGKKVAVKYIGKLKNGTIFDSTVGRKPFEFRLGIGQVIKGWDIGVNGMRIGDKRRITIPPTLGYGKERTGQIPPNSTLVFDVELVNVK